jgi:hypothetical protein
MRFVKLFALLIFIFVVICAFSFFTNKNEFGIWHIKSVRKDQAIPWAKFYWGGDSLSGKYYERTYMFVPLKMEGLPYTFRLQFDLGDPFTELYEKNLLSLFGKHPYLQNNYGRLKGPLQFWNGKKSYKSLTF